jgi:cell division protein FtsB
MRSRRRWPVLLCALGVLGYFGYHAVEGRHGLGARTALETRAARLSTELAALETHRTQLQREVKLLSEEAPDPDYVEELARTLLGYARPGDRIVIDRPARTATAG